MTSATTTTQPITPPVPRHVVVMRIIVSVSVMIAGFAILTAPNFLVNHRPDDSVQKFAAGWIGAAVGYWLA